MFLQIINKVSGAEEKFVCTPAMLQFLTANLRLATVVLNKRDRIINNLCAYLKNLAIE